MSNIVFSAEQAIHIWIELFCYPKVFEFLQTQRRVFKDMAHKRFGMIGRSGLFIGPVQTLLGMHV